MEPWTLDYTIEYKVGNVNSAVTNVCEAVKADAEFDSVYNVLAEEKLLKLWQTTVDNVRGIVRDV